MGCDTQPRVAAAPAPWTPASCAGRRAWARRPARSNKHVLPGW